MEYRTLGDTDLRVSAVCLGTMTWGEQNSEAEAHSQLDYAVERGVNFIDTAEMYPVPPRAGTVGRTEQHLGSWLARRGRREDLVLATKASGPGLDHVRGGAPSFDEAGLREALEGSLERLGTDYVDLYQLHWPERRANYFGRLGYRATDDGPAPRIEATLEALAALVEEGRVRFVGLSNETPWGVMRFLRAAEEFGLPRVVSIQNPYNLLNRSFEVGLAEVSHRERVGLLAYSPLAFGMLSGKYLDGARPAGARITLFERFSRYLNAQGEAATARYVALARERGWDPAQMALAFVTAQPFVTANIIGATTMEQLAADIDGALLPMDGELAEAIDAVHAEIPNPCP